jgi:hypothetical protein
LDDNGNRRKDLSHVWIPKPDGWEEKKKGDDDCWCPAINSPKGRKTNVFLKRNAAIVEKRLASVQDNPIKKRKLDKMLKHRT